MRPDWKRLIKAFICLVASAALTLTLPQEALGDDNLKNKIITIFSVFAGFMIALMAVTAALPSHSDWKKLSVEKEIAAAKLFRQHLLFFGYLATLGLIVLSDLLAYYEFGGFSTLINELLTRTYIFVALFSLMMSFLLPGSLRNAHEKIFREHIKNIKNKEL